MTALDSSAEGNGNSPYDNNISRHKLANDADTDVEYEGDDEAISDEGVVYQINTFGADYTVDGLVKRFDRGDIFRPPFQRNFVWSQPQASRFVESILLGLPVPSIFLYKEEATQKNLIVDGLQRLTTLHAFTKGRLPHTNRIFRLQGVKNRFEGKILEELEPEDQRRFEDAIIHTMVIQQIAPDDSNGSVFHIFERLNSNGTPLHPQEMRAAIYHGPFQDLLGKLNENKDWRAIFGNVHKRAKDQELILRFLALSCELESYQKPMKGFLNKFMQTNRYISEEAQEKYRAAFFRAIGMARAALGDKAFRPARAFNVAVFDAIMVAIARTESLTADNLRSAYERVVADEAFWQMASESTSNESNVVGRVRLAMDTINATA